MKKSTTYNKLVRDKIPEIIANHPKRQKAVYHKLEDSQEIEDAICAKLLEESKELIREYRDLHPENILKEAADVLAVVSLIISRCGFRWTDVDKASRESLRVKGSFEELYFLESVEDRDETSDV